MNLIEIKNVLKEFFLISPESIEKIENTFSSLMDILYKNGYAEDYHIPSESYEVTVRDKRYILKIIPRYYLDRIVKVNTILRKLNESKEIYPNSIGDSPVMIKEDVLILLKTNYGVFIKEDLAKKNHKQITEGFIDLHWDLEKIEEEVIDYEKIISFEKTKENIRVITTKIKNKVINNFDRKVLEHLQKIENMITNSQIKNTLEYSWKKSQLVHGDYKLNNLVWNTDLNKIIEIIDFDMMHNGPIALQISLTAESIFGYGTEDYFNFIEEVFKTLNISKEDILNIPEAHITHKALNLIVFKVVYFLNNEKYEQLKDYLLAQINNFAEFINKKELVKNRLMEIKI
jgi:hypothetical protein